MQFISLQGSLPLHLKTRKFKDYVEGDIYLDTKNSEYLPHSSKRDSNHINSKVQLENNRMS